MSVLSYILPLVCIAIGVGLGYGLARRGRYGTIAVLFLAAVGIFLLCIERAEGLSGWDGIGYAIVALLVIIPAAGGLVIGLVIGAVRRWRRRRLHG